MAANVIAKRYRGADTAGALDMEDVSPQVSTAIAAAINIDSKHVAEIVIGICNPARYGKMEDGRGLRWCDNFTADRTAVYYTWDKPNTNTCWPQAPGVYFPLRHAVGNGGVNPQAVIPARNSALQLTNFLFMTSLRRTIRENKNPSGAYTTYDWYSTNGYKDFIIAQPGVNNTATTQIIPGGASYSGNLTAIAGGSGYQNAMAFGAGGGVGGFGNVNPAQSIAPYTGGGQTLPASSFLPMHGQFLPGETFGGRTFIWNDGYSGIGGTAQAQNAPSSNASPPAFTASGPVGTWIDSTGQHVFRWRHGRSAARRSRDHERVGGAERILSRPSAERSELRGQHLALQQQAAGVVLLSLRSCGHRIHIWRHVLHHDHISRLLCH